MELLMFYIFGFGAVVSALLMVTNKRPVRAAMSLVATMSFVAGLYVLLDAHLIAVLQLIIYAGAIMVLFLFVIMLLNIEEKEGLVEIPSDFGTTKAVGRMLFTQYLLPFEIASILLLAAIVGAVILAKRRIDGSGR